MSDDSTEKYVTIIQSKDKQKKIDWQELYHFRELFGILVWRDVKVKYKQTALGALWAIIVPFIQMVIFTVIFGNVAKLPTDGLHPQVFYYSGLLLWTYFATAVTFSGNSLVAGKAFLTKIYFPRLIMPIAPTLSALVDFIIGFSILIAMMIYYQQGVDYAIIFLPIFVIIAVATASGVGMIFASLNVKYRDIGFALPFIVQIWMYGSVIVPFSKLPPAWGDLRYLYGINPMSGAIEGFRWCLLHGNMLTTRLVEGKVVEIPVDPPILLVAISAVSAAFLFWLGINWFKKMESTFADIV